MKIIALDRHSAKNCLFVKTTKQKTSLLKRGFFIPIKFIII